MFALPALLALAATQPTPAAAPASQARAQAQVLVRIIQAAEVRGGGTKAPHQRTIRSGTSGEALILLEFE